MFKEITIYLQEYKKFVRIAEGDGSNLSDEDQNLGYEDYVMIYVYEYNQGDLEEINGGQMMLYNPFDAIFGTDKNKLIHHACEFMEMSYVPYIVIEEIGY